MCTLNVSALKDVDKEPDVEQLGEGGGTAVALSTSISSKRF